MKRSRLILLMLLLAGPVLNAQVPDSAGADDADAAALRGQIRQRWHEHIRQTLGLSDEQAGKVQATEDRFEQQRMQYRSQMRDINRQINGESLSATPNNERINGLIRQQQETRLRLAQMDRDEDVEMAGYLSPMQRVRYQRQRSILRERIQEMIRHPRARGMIGGGGRRGRAQRGEDGATPRGPGKRRKP